MSTYYNRYEYYDTGRDGDANLFGNNWAAQSFQPQVDHTIRWIRLSGAKFASFTGFATISIRTSLTGADLVTMIVQAADWPSSTQWFLIPLPTPLAVTAGVTYYIVGRSNATGSTSCPRWDNDNTASTYPRGTKWTSSNGGSSWTQAPTADMYFEEGDYWWGCETAAATGITDTTANTPGTATTNSSLTDLTKYGVDYGIESGVYTEEAIVESSPGASFSVPLTGLYPSTLYYFRVKVYHPTYGWIYGSQLYFKTAADGSLLQHQTFLTETFQVECYGVNWRATTFTVDHSFFAKAIRLRMFAVGTPNYEFKCGIRAVDGSDKPTGDDIVWGAFIATTALGGTPGTWVEFGFRDGYLFEAGQKYSIVCRMPSGTSSHYVRIRQGITAALTSWQSNNSGSTWTSSTYDFVFYLLGEGGVLTNPASEIGSTQAVGNGFMLDTTNVNEIGFEWGTVQGGPYPNSVTDTTTPFFPGDYSLLMTGLSGSQVYYYRAKVYDTGFGAWLYGDEETFETLPPTPVVQTDPPDNIVVGEATATMDGNGEILSIGAENADTRGFVYGRTSKSQPSYATAPGSSGYDAFVSESGSFGVGTFSLAISGLSPNKKYFIRAFAHNSYGYHYGKELIVYVSDTISILYPSGTSSEGIRFNTSPGGNYPKIGTKSIPDYVLCRNEDSYWYSNVRWGYITGSYAYERHYYNSNMYTDLFTLTNPHIRTEGIIKAKWRATFNKNAYPFGKFQRHLVTHSTQYNGTLTDIARDPITSNDRRCEIFYTNPFTGSAWTVAELDALVAGASVGEEASYGIAALDYLVVIACWANGEARTDPATPIDDTSAQLNGYIVEDEGEEVEVYFEWGETDAYGNETTHQTGKSRGDYFSAVVSGLTPGATYHCRAVLITLCGETFYGEDRTFPFLSYPGIWLGTGPTDRYLMEITDHVMGYRTEAGRDEELGHAASGIAELTCDNWDGRFSPEKTDGAYYGFLYLGAYLTIIEDYKGVTYFRFSGKIDKISPHPEPDNRVGYIVAVDGMDDLAGTEIETVLRTDTDEQELIGDILDAAKWLAGMRSLDAGIDVLQLGWFHQEFALSSIQDLEDATRGLFFVDPEGYAVWQNRHYRVTGARLTSQYTFNESAVEVQYEWSKRDIKNWVRVTGYKYVDPYYGLPEEEWLWYAPANSEAAPFIPAGSTITIWAMLQGPRKSSDALSKGSQWNANTKYDKTGDDVSDDITVTPAYYGQSIKFTVENSGTKDAYLVVPDSPPAGAPDNGTLLVYGTIYEELVMTVVQEDTTSQDDYGKRTLSVNARFKSNYVDILAYSQWLIARYKDPLPSPIRIKVNPWWDLPDDEMKLVTLTLKISDRVTVTSSHLGISQDYFIDKIIHEYAVNEGGWVETTEYWLSRASGQAEDLYWLLEIPGFSELEETTRLGF